MQPESIKEDDSAAEQQEAHDQRTENASMGEEPHDDQEALEDEHVEDEHAEHNDDEQHGDDVYEQEGQENAGYDIDVYDNINGQGDAGNALLTERSPISRLHVCVLALPDTEVCTDLEAEEC